MTTDPNVCKREGDEGMIVVLDTSAFGEDLALRGSAIRLLTAQGPNAGLSFSLPRVVVDELVGRFTKRVEREQTKRKSTTDNVLRVLPERNPKPNLFGDSYTDKLVLRGDVG